MNYELAQPTNTSQAVGNNPMNPTQDWREEFVEKGADMEHERWAGWQKYLHSHCVRDSMGNLIIPAKSVRRWEQQILTPYSDLSEAEKESDRKEVRKYLPFIESLIERGRLQGIEEAIDVIEAEGEWVKEDVADGNYGYFRADEKLLNEVRKLKGE